MDVGAAVLEVLEVVLVVVERVVRESVRLGEAKLAPEVVDDVLGVVLLLIEVEEIGFGAVEVDVAADGEAEVVLLLVEDVELSVVELDAVVDEVAEAVVEVVLLLVELEDVELDVIGLDAIADEVTKVDVVVAEAVIDNAVGLDCVVEVVELVLEVVLLLVELEDVEFAVVEIGVVTDELPEVAEFVAEAVKVKVAVLDRVVKVVEFAVEDPVGREVVDKLVITVEIATVVFGPVWLMSVELDVLDIDELEIVGVMVPEVVEFGRIADDNDEAKGEAVEVTVADVEEVVVLLFV